MKTVLFVTATMKEMKAAIGGLGPLPQLEQGRVSRHCVKGRECLLLVTGIGIVNAAFAIGEALAGAEPEVAVLAGVAGTFYPERLPVGSSCTVTTEIWPEYGLRTVDEVDPRGIGFSLGRPGGENVWDRIGLERDYTACGLGMPDVTGDAVSLTVSGVTGTADQADALRLRYGADIENMEGFAVAYGCALRGVPMCELRTVSNLVGSRRADDWNLGAAFGELGRICSRIF